MKASTAKPSAYLYKRVRWLKLRERVLTEQPLCVFCLLSEEIEPATVVDHIKPHKGNEELFWDEANLQPLCKPHHDGDKQRMERGQTIVRFGSDGWPID